MKIHKTQPNNVDSPQWKSDAPLIKGMRAVLPVTALLSAVSLAGGISSFSGLSFQTLFGLSCLIALIIAALKFDAIGINAGQSIVREFILIRSGQIEKPDYIGFLGLSFSFLICVSVVFASFNMSRDGVSYLVISLRDRAGVNMIRDTTLSGAIEGEKAQSEAKLAAITEAYESKVSAINAKYDGKIAAYNADIKRRKAQNKSTSYYEKLIGRAEENRGDELTKAAESYQAAQDQTFQQYGKLSEIAIKQAETENRELSKLKEEKQQQDQMLSDLVSSIFSWSVVLMLFIGVSLTILETRNGILPNPILTESDLSGGQTVTRVLLSIPNFLYACLFWLSEKLYHISPKRPIPVVDNDLTDYRASQMIVTAKRKEVARSIKTEKAEKEILAEVKKAEAGEIERKVNAFDLIQMYLQTNDADEITAFYARCVSFVTGMGSNPFHERNRIGFVTNSERNSSLNAIRYGERIPNGFSENSIAKVPEGHKVCEQCRTVFSPNVSFQKFCSNTCRGAFHRERGGHEKEYKDRFKN